MWGEFGMSTSGPWYQRQGLQRIWVQVVWSE
jgi:hypothetical protein